MKRFLLLLCALWVVGRAGAQILVETESFAHLGGWVADHQAFPQIGSSYLMAHGLGRPVEDATTTVQVPRAGDYHVYVSTYNWTAPWYEGKGPGSFQLLVNQVPLGEELGTTGKAWGWQYAGAVHLDKGELHLALHDLTGFNGRCDAVYFSPVPSPPSADYEAFAAERLRLLGYGVPKRITGADLVVVGGGIAGCTTALTAARYGLRVVLVDNLPWLGGNHALGVRANGLMFQNLYPELGNITCQVLNASLDEKNNPEAYFVRENRTGYINSYVPIPALRDYEGPASELMNQALDKLSVYERQNATKSEQNQNNNEYRRKQQAQIRKDLLLEAGVELYQNVQVYGAATEAESVLSVRGKHLRTGEAFDFEGALFVDCTGDGVLGYLAGAEYRMGRESKAYAQEPSSPEVEDQKKMGMSMTHQALGTVRVQATLGMAGEVIGMAAHLCKKHATTPRGIYQNHLPELKKLMRKGAPLR